MGKHSAIPGLYLHGTLGGMALPASFVLRLLEGRERIAATVHENCLIDAPMLSYCLKNLPSVVGGRNWRREAPSLVQKIGWIKDLASGRCG
jgi:hypothetical protein